MLWRFIAITTMKKLMRLVSAMLLLLGLAGCDNGYSPVVVNAYDYPVEITIHFVGEAPSVVGILPSGRELVQRRKGLEIKEIHVKEPSGRLHIYESTELNRMRAANSHSFEIWILSESGIALGDERYLKRLQRNRQ